MQGTVVSIHIAEEEGGALRPVGEAKLVSGMGIVGDRYFAKEGREPNQELTLVASEQIAQFNTESGLSIEPSQTRRNIVTRGISLNDLVGQVFTVGEAHVQGLELCEPCEYLTGHILASLPADSTTAPKLSSQKTPISFGMRPCC